MPLDSVFIAEFTSGENWDDEDEWSQPSITTQSN